ncbi:permease [Formosa sp. PL04]|uniref:permease n=1 Tax=Formosa sp. PL04 TaxID=3081755 RepID=UPI0029822EE4|nr:permease [Formosa sp. PL04]MDW5290899.1 permease [Formosa sp. PL04]
MGAVISEISAVFVPDTFVEKHFGSDNSLSIFFAAIIGISLCFLTEMAIPLLRVLIRKGRSMGAEKASLIGGKGASLPKMAIVSSMLKPKAVTAFVGFILAITIIDGYIFCFLF